MGQQQQQFFYHKIVRLNICIVKGKMILKGGNIGGKKN